MKQNSLTEIKEITHVSSVSNCICVYENDLCFCYLISLSNIENWVSEDRSLPIETQITPAYVIRSLLGLNNDL